MKTYEIMGTAYPLAFTLGAMDRVMELCGGIDKVATAFDGKPAQDQTALLVDLLHALLIGGRDYLRAAGDEAAEPPTKIQLKAGLFPRDIQDAKLAIFEAMTEGMKRTVTVEPDPKNVGTTRAK